MPRKRTIPSDVLQKARKLCALSDDPAASTYEIEQALKAAHDLLLPYGLTVEEVLESLHRDIVEEVYHIDRMRRVKWLHDLMMHVAVFCDTRVLFRTGSAVNYRYIGLMSQVQRAMFHAETLHEQVDYYGDCRAPRAMRDIRVYKQGVVDRVAETMRDLRSDKERVTESLIASVVETIQAQPHGSHVLVLAHVTPDKLHCFTKARIDGEIVNIDELSDLSASPDATVEVVVDRIRMRQGLDARIRDDVQASFSWGFDVAVENLDTAERNAFTRRKKDVYRRLPVDVMSKLDTLLAARVDSYNPRLMASPLGSSGAYSWNPDYAVGYQHGAEIKIRAGLR